MEEFGLALSAPLHVELALTSLCQLRCDYCSAMPFSGRMMATSRTLALAQEFSRLGVFSLLLSGGEPTIHPDFIEILNAYSQAVPEVTVNTNGLKLAELAFAKQLHATAPTSVVAISLDSPNPQANNLHRGSGCMEAIRAVEHLIEVDQPVCISTVLTGDNFDSAEGLIDMFFPAVRAFRFFPQVPRGQEDISYTDTDYWSRVDEFYLTLQRRADANPELRLLTPATEITTGTDGLIFRKVKSCCCAFTKAFVSSDLLVYPCYYSANVDTCLGDLTKDSFAAVWSGERAKACRVVARSRSLCGLTLNKCAIPHRYERAVSLKG